MTVTEIRRTYNELREILTSLGLTWVVHQVEETIQAGHAVEKETRIFRDEEPVEQIPTFREQHSAPRRPGKASLMMTLERWTDADQLLFLIDGVRQAIVQAADVENEQLRLLRTVVRVPGPQPGAPPVESVRFESEVEDTDRSTLKLTGQTDERIDMIGKLLDALEKEVRE